MARRRQTPQQVVNRSSEAEAAIAGGSAAPDHIRSDNGPAFTARAVREVPVPAGPVPLLVRRTLRVVQTSGAGHFKRFPNEQAAVEAIEARRWENGVVCPHCESERTTSLSGGYYHQCNNKECRKQFTVRTGTIFERSHIPLDKWLYAMYLLQTARKGISSLQLSKELGITQKSAWFLLHRLREAFDIEAVRMDGEVEIDETYIGGKESNKHESKKLNASRGTVGKQAVLGMREREGRVVAKPIDSTGSQTIQSEVLNTVEEGATLYTDEHRAYTGLEAVYEHQAVKHSVKEFVNEMAHTNGIESVWAVLKRGYNGVYHHWSKKHMRRYVNEFVFRLNEGNVRNHTMVRLDHIIRNAVGKRLTYKELTQGWE